MNLNLEQIRSITLGAQSVTEDEKGIHFCRFSKAQAAYYAENPKVASASGIKLSFFTNSETLKIAFDLNYTTSRKYFALDVFADGKFCGDIRNFEELEIGRKYTLEEHSLEPCEGEFSLGQGEKKVVVHLPWNMEVLLKEFSLDDGATLTPCRPAKKLLCYGDSITQGFDALHPSRRYTAQLAEYLDMEEFNMGIGGELFRPELAALPAEFTPDFITVAYGTNDWRDRETEVFREACFTFYENLTKTFPGTPILAISPLWRKIWERESICCPFRDVHKFIESVAERLPNVTVLDGFDLIPHYSDYFADLTLHPNGAGYDRYFEGIRDFLEKNK